MRQIGGGITVARGFSARSVFCGIKDGNADRPDLTLIASEVPSVAAAVFTTNRIKAAPVRLSTAHLRSAVTRAIVANSGNANACTGKTGDRDARSMARNCARLLRIDTRQVLVCSTGRIGVPLPMKKIERGLSLLSGSNVRMGSTEAARAIMTSDTFAKECAVQIKLDGKPVRIGGIAKGAGMINPQMATMLCFLSTDAAISKKVLQRFLVSAVEQSFNRITVDGDMSTNDSVICLANGLAGNSRDALSSSGDFQKALNFVTAKLARMIVEDGEGITRVIEVIVRGAASQSDALKAVRAIANSALVKCAWFGGDPNWGRVMDALGYSGARLREERVEIFYDNLCAVRGGVAIPSAKNLRTVTRKKQFKLTVDLHLGKGTDRILTTDFTPAYVEFNKGE
jgi:glutamate N-acetyltransferase/amino-acid N-acetyltransferase